MAKSRNISTNPTDEELKKQEEIANRTTSTVSGKETTLQIPEGSVMYLKTKQGYALPAMTLEQALQDHILKQLPESKKNLLLKGRNSSQMIVDMEKAKG